jgi:hypothetical protein
MQNRNAANDIMSAGIRRGLVSIESIQWFRDLFGCRTNVLPVVYLRGRRFLGCLIAYHLSMILRIKQ